MAKNDLYDGMEIIHLEDFTNKIQLNVDHPSISIGSGTSSSRTIPTSNQIQRTILGDIGVVCYGLTGVGGIYSSAGSVGGNPRIRTVIPSAVVGSIPPHISSGELVMEVAAVRNSTNNLHYVSPSAGTSRLTCRIGLLFTIPSGYGDKRTILSFDYRPVDGPIIGTRNGTQECSRIVIRADDSRGTVDFSFHELVPFTNRHLPGKLEFIFESGRLKVYFRNKMIGDVAHTKPTIFFGEYWQTQDDRLFLGDVPNLGCPFSISNLVMVAVPLESPVKRLGNIRVQRALVNNLDDEEHTSEDALNGESTNDGKSLEVDHNTNTIKFESIELKDGENIVGSQMCISGINTETGSNIETKVSDGEEVLTDKTHLLIETHLSREVVDDYILGDDPEDYEDIKLEVRSVEV